MNMRPLLALCGATALAVMSAGSAAAQDNRDPQQSGVEVLTRGPVHEAYAQPAEPRPEASPVISKQPPAPIDEMPPEQKPEGDDVVWIAGYWAWDDDSRDFIWISGFWRDAPPSRNWVPGHWQQVDQGWQWVSGFWAREDTEQVEYLPPPPENIERGPSTPVPDQNATYVPGIWMWNDARYAWRPGFWLPFRPGWVWVPAHYVWTPVGFIFVEGYWDMPLHERGLLFSPVRFARGVVVDRFVYVPQYVVQTDFLMTALFVRPAFREYFFGDYFDRAYVDRGFVPWVDYRPFRNANVMDVNLTYYRNRLGGQAWAQNLQSIYQGRLRGDIPRPPQTLAQQAQVINNLKQKNVTINNVTVNNLQLVSAVAPISQMNNTTVTAMANLAGKTDARAEVRQVKLSEVSKEQRAALQQVSRQYHEVSQKRQQAEARLIAEAPKVKGQQPRAVKLDLPPPPARTKNPMTGLTPPAAKRAREVPPAPPLPKPARTAPGAQEEPVPPKGKSDLPPTPKGKDEPPPAKGKVEPPARPKDVEPPAPPAPKKVEPPARPKDVEPTPPRPRKDEEPPLPKQKKDDRPPAAAPAPPPPPPPQPPAQPAPPRPKDKKDKDKDKD
jgi:WXXGXW repeat (2 copies)